MYLLTYACPDDNEILKVIKSYLDFLHFQYDIDSINDWWKINCLELNIENKKCCPFVQLKTFLILIQTKK